MPLSIFNFSNVARAFRLPFGTTCWLLAILAAGGVMYKGAVDQINRTYTPKKTNHLTAAIEHLSPETELMFLGSSHMAAGINPSYFDKEVANISLNAGNYEVLEILFKSHIEKMPNLKYVILEADNTCLALDRLNETRDFVELNYLGGDLAHYPKSDSWKSFQRIINQDGIYPVLFYNRLTPYEYVYKRKLAYTREERSRINQQKHAGLAEMPDWPFNRKEPGKPVPGHSPHMHVMNQERMDRIDGITFNDPVFWDRVERNSVALERLLARIDEHKVQPIFFRFPYTYAYHRWNTPEWEEVDQAMMAYLKERYNDRFVFWEIPQKPYFELSDFSDSQHLNKWGAIKMSTYLNDWVNELE
ncbi:MAG: hypothetical protein ACI9TH_000027 [Kiritimatiellia bacterium]|jgi:hypothetical protein